LREKRRLRVFENRVLRRIFGPERDEVRGEWEKRGYSVKESIWGVWRLWGRKRCIQNSRQEV
jgi:hypothetical protein